MTAEKTNQELVKNGSLIEKRDFAFKAPPSEVVLKLLKENQFSNPYDAFRELVSNSIDSESSKIRVQVSISNDDEGSKTKFRIVDDGHGFTDKDLQALLNIGKSGKEGSDAIGRFGIGFYSILSDRLGFESAVIRTACGTSKHTVKFDKDTLPFAEVKDMSDVEKGTEIEIIFSYADKSRIMKSIENSCKYSSVPIIVNGQKINEKIDSGFDFVLKRAFENNGVSGIIGLGNTQMPSRLLSHEILVETTNKEAMVQYAVNYDSLNPLISRNEVMKDQEYQKLYDVLDGEKAKLLE